jgi:hypothetical protein
MRRGQKDYDFDQPMQKVSDAPFQVERCLHHQLEGFTRDLRYLDTFDMNLAPIFGNSDALSSRDATLKYDKVDSLDQEIEDEIFEISCDTPLLHQSSQDDCLNFMSKPELFHPSKQNSRSIFNFQTSLVIILENRTRKGISEAGIKSSLPDVMG